MQQSQQQQHQQQQHQQQQGVLEEEEVQGMDNQVARTPAHCSGNRPCQQQDLPQKDMFVCTLCMVLPIEQGELQLVTALLAAGPGCCVRLTFVPGLNQLLVNLQTAQSFQVGCVHVGHAGSLSRKLGE
jgi:hypothetical protein